LIYGIRRGATRLLGGLLSNRARKYLRFIAVRAIEATGRDYFPAHDALDRKLLRHIGNIRNGTFIEAGANDGLAQSNTWHLERRRGWRGLLIEPVPEIAELCRRFRKSQVECTALGRFDQEGEFVTMHFGALMTAAEGADASHMQGGSAAEHARAGANWIGRKSYSFKAPVHALSTLIDRARLTSIDLLSLDVEGFEVPVLEGIDFDRHPICFILVETSNLAAVEEVLGLRYRLVEKLSRHDYLFEHLS
jgi:FkbM family methyltransferase